MTTATKNIIHKLETLPDNMVNEVEDFIDFLKAKHAKSFPKSGNAENKIVEEPKSLYGAAKGLFIIPKDFNEPLDDLKDYM
ncbi:type II toxin-antitoxin system VapB family antitoxin [Pedobacter sp. GSP4]|uniref:type II toxin-antitoxin system VapB family antitoxin n=1 Tax=Pedobacter sp. GSP4 TaxID=3453716 RepID=UPI003EECF774